MAFNNVRQSLDDFIPDFDYVLLDGIKRVLNKWFPDEHFFPPSIDVLLDDDVILVPQPSPVTIDVSGNDDKDDFDDMLTEITPKDAYDPRKEAVKLGVSKPKPRVVAKKQRRQTLYIQKPPPPITQAKSKPRRNSVGILGIKDKVHHTRSLRNLPHRI